MNFYDRMTPAERLTRLEQELRAVSAHATLANFPNRSDEQRRESIGNFLDNLEYLNELAKRIKTDWQL